MEQHKSGTGLLASAAEKQNSQKKTRRISSREPPERRGTTAGGGAVSAWLGGGGGGLGAGSAGALCPLKVGCCLELRLAGADPPATPPMTRPVPSAQGPGTRLCALWPTWAVVHRKKKDATNPQPTHRDAKGPAQHLWAQRRRSQSGLPMKFLPFGCGQTKNVDNFLLKTHDNSHTRKCQPAHLLSFDGTPQSPIRPPNLQQWGSSFFITTYNPLTLAMAPRWRSLRSHNPHSCWVWPRYGRGRVATFHTHCGCGPNTTA